MDDMRVWLTPAEIAQELGVTGETVRRWIRERRLAASARVVNERISYRVSRSSYEEFCRDHIRDTMTDDWE